ncbi:uncharacterized protein LOC130794322 [Actinidia eriantha]|uniref:uncharacterized protein LOC130794322 n=1 Tax=Actinidia eriantha TaxID=165200 RepID=UPI002589FE36|nr:uncharacterized protein LOC130794322 [Actinidia eriantha]
MLRKPSLLSLSKHRRMVSSMEENRATASRLVIELSDIDLDCVQFLHIESDDEDLNDNDRLDFMSHGYWFIEYDILLQAERAREKRLGFQSSRLKGKHTCRVKGCQWIIGILR